MSSLTWKPGFNGATLIAQLSDRKYIVRSDITYRLGRADVQWVAACTMTPGPYLFLTRNLPNREAAILLCQQHHNNNALEVNA